ncbi:MAG TPA: tetratricopeptide repeat protein [Blastocatellia bacterium]|nr:tetratricopeptide repeat protein [Blastocatellia bacterium]
MGGHHSELGKYEEAARLLDQAVKLRSVGEASSTDDTVGAELAQAYNALGVCYAYQGDYPHAEVSFRRALRHNERMIEAYTNLALIYRSQEPESADERETELELLLEAAGNRVRSAP